MRRSLRRNELVRFLNKFRKGRRMVYSFSKAMQLRNRIEDMVSYNYDCRQSGVEIGGGGEGVFV